MMNQTSIPEKRKMKIKDVRQLAGVVELSWEVTLAGESVY